MQLYHAMLGDFDDTCPSLDISFYLAASYSTHLRRPLDLRERILSTGPFLGHFVHCWGSHYINPQTVPHRLWSSNEPDDRAWHNCKLSLVSTGNEGVIILTQTIQVYFSIGTVTSAHLQSMPWHSSESAKHSRFRRNRHRDCGHVVM